MGVEPIAVQVPTNVCDSVVLFYFDGVVSCGDCGDIASKERRVSYVKYGSVEEVIFIHDIRTIHFQRSRHDGLRNSSAVNVYERLRNASIS